MRNGKEQQKTLTRDFDVRYRLSRSERERVSANRRRHRATKRPEPLRPASRSRSPVKSPPLGTPCFKAGQGKVRQGIGAAGWSPRGPLLFTPESRARSTSRSTPGTESTIETPSFAAPVPSRADRRASSSIRPRVRSSARRRRYRSRRRPPSRAGKTGSRARSPRLPS